MKYLQLFCAFAFVVSSLLSGHARAFGTDTYEGAEAVPDHLKPGFDTISEERSEELLRVFVERGFDGRGTGQEGYVRAAHFVAGRLAEYGFEPIGDNGTYFQNLPFFRATADPEASSISIGDTSISGAGAIGFQNFSGSFRAEGEVLVVQTDDARPDLGDPAQYRGKIVVVTGTPIDRRVLFRIRGDAVCILTVVEGEPANDTINSRGGGLGTGAIVGELSQEAADRLMGELGVEIDPAADGFSLHGSDAVVALDLKVVRQPMMVPNVVGWMEGSDPELADEYIVIGGHLDHLGVNGDRLYPGADDNGSGSTAILQVARALFENPTKPKRSVLYIAFAAEEIGLLGSKYFVDNPLKPLDNCICMFNIDMVGRNEETNTEPASENLDSIHLIGAQQYSDSLHDVILAANEHVGFRFEYDEEENVFRRSDHANFYDHDIPVAFLFGGFNPHYHQTTDGMNDINFSKIANCARLYYLSIHMVAEHGRFTRDE